MGAYQYLHWQSSHPATAKIAIPVGEYIRRSRIINDSTNIGTTREDSVKKLRRRGYPAFVLMHAFQRAQEIITTQKLDISLIITHIYTNITHTQIKLLSHQTLLVKIVFKRKSSSFPWNTYEMLDPNQTNDNEVIWPIILPYNAKYTTNIQALKKLLTDRIQVYNTQLMRYYKLDLPLNIRTIIAYKRNKKLINILNNT